METTVLYLTVPALRPCTYVSKAQLSFGSEEAGAPVMHPDVMVQTQTRALLVLDSELF